MIDEFPITLEAMLAIERKAYPKKWQQMQWATTWEGLARGYGDVDVDRLVVLSDGATWYFLAARRSLHGCYVLDRAKLPGSPLMDWIAIYKELVRREIYVVSGDMRETTSYKRFKAQQEVFERQLSMQLLADQPHHSNGETMHHVMIGFRPEATP